MRLAFGILFLWLGCAMLYLAQVDIQEDTPWAAYRTLLKEIGGE